MLDAFHAWLPPATLAMGQNFQQNFATQSRWLAVLLLQLPIALAPALFTWLIPALLGYRRGGMALIGIFFSVALLVLLPLKELFDPLPRWYHSIHPWLFGIFYVYGIAGLAVCAVGIHDRKRSAIWAILAVAALVGAAIWDSLVWFGLVTSAPMVPWGFIGFALLLTVGFIRRRADPPPKNDLRRSAETMANNRTRRSQSIPRKLLREGSIHLLPLYFFVNMSTLGHEGINNSGSYLFADHIYRNIPGGRNKLGEWIDRKVLAMPATQAFRNRYLKAQEIMRRALEGFPKDLRPIRILAIPCGIPRDAVELADALDRDGSELLQRIEYVGMDVDPDLLQKAQAFLEKSPLKKFRIHRGNALLKEEFPPGPFHLIVSTGLGEFLDDHDLQIFYHNVHDALAPGGTFYTSATRKEKRSDALLTAVELETHYRTPTQLEKIIQQQTWSRIKLVQDDSGLQTFLTAMK